MKNIIQEPNGKWCSKRILALGFGIAAIIAAFVPHVSEAVVITFATISMGTHTLTAKQFENCHVDNYSTKDGAR